MVKCIRKGSSFCLLIAAIVAMGTGARRARASICCSSLKQVMINCSSPGCHGTVTFYQCLSGSTGICADEFSWHCCGSSGNTYASNGSTCGNGQTCLAASPLAQFSLGGFTRPIFLRDCSGQYTLLRPGGTS